MKEALAPYAQYVSEKAGVRVESVDPGVLAGYVEGDYPARAAAAPRGTGGSGSQRRRSSSTRIHADRAALQIRCSA